MRAETAASGAPDAIADETPAGGAGAGNPSFAVYRLSPGGRRLGKVNATFAGGVLRFTARTDLDPSAATLLSEIAR